MSQYLDYYLTTVLKDTKKAGGHCGAIASRFAPFSLCICAKPLKPLGHQRSSVDGLITPTLKAAGSNPVGRTKRIPRASMALGILILYSTHLGTHFLIYFTAGDNPAARSLASKPPPR